MTSIDVLLNLRTAQRTLIIRHSLIADQVLPELVQFSSVTSVQLKAKLLTRTFAHANLRSLAPVQRNVVLGTLADVKEEQVRFVLNFAVNATLQPLGVRRHEQPIQVAMVQSYARTQSRPCVSSSSLFSDSQHLP